MTRAHILPFLVALGLAPSVARAAAPMPCAPVVQGPPRHHHVLALDASGSVIRHIPAMKAFLACYAQMYALPGEEVSLVAFARDEHAGVKLLRTFTVPSAGTAAILNELLDDLEIQRPSRTRTYFRPVARFLDGFLRTVKLDPVVIVVSDGKSDSPSREQPGAKEVPFERFGRRGIYALPGARGWRVAITGGQELPLVHLFKRPLPERRPRRAPPRREVALAPGIDPCLIDPALLLETDGELVLRPHWNPFRREARGTLGLRARTDCAARFRTFTVELKLGSQSVALGSVKNALVTENARRFELPVVLHDPPASEDATLGIVLEQGGSTRSIYSRPPSVVLRTASWWSAYGGRAVGLGSGALSVVGLMVWVVRRRWTSVRERPELVKVLGGRPVPLLAGRSTSIGGEGCSIVVPGVPDGVTCATATIGGARGELVLRAADGFELRANSGAPAEETSYRLGQPLELVETATGVTHRATIHPAGDGAHGPGAGGSRFAKALRESEAGGSTLNSFI